MEQNFLMEDREIEEPESLVSPNSTKLDIQQSITVQRDIIAYGDYIEEEQPFTEIVTEHIRGPSAL